MFKQSNPSRLVQICEIKTLTINILLHDPNQVAKKPWSSTLRAQYEQIDGTDDASELMRLNFRKR